MAREEKIWEYARQAGYEPLEDRCIIVKYAPENYDMCEYAGSAVIQLRARGLRSKY